MRLYATALATALLLASAARAQDAQPLSMEELAGRAAQVTMFVPPDYPEAALREGIEATVDVVGTVRTDGTLAVGRIEVTPEREDFRRAVMEVARFWLFRPSYDPLCRAQEAEGRLRVWFEIKDGKPVLSLSAPRKTQAPKPAEGDRELYRTLRRVSPVYPPGVVPRVREAGIEALLRVSDSGAVEEVVIVPGPNSGLFGDAVRVALSQWVFVAGTRPKKCFEYQLVFRASDMPPPRNIRATTGNAPGGDGR